jgi:hypothetical protein
MSQLRTLLRVVLLVAGLVVVFGSARAEAAWGTSYVWRPPARLGPPDQSWLMDVPEKAGGRSRGKVAVFAIRGDEYYQPVRAAVVKTLRRRGLSVTASLRPVDSAAQFRELSQTLNLAVYVDGEMRGEGARQSVVIRLRSGVSNQTIASARFSGPTPKIVGDVGRTLWTKVGPSVTRACTSAAKPRKREREPLRIDAGSSDDTPIAVQGS